MILSSGLFRCLHLIVLPLHTNITNHHRTVLCITKNIAHNATPGKWSIHSSHKISKNLRTQNTDAQCCQLRDLHTDKHNAHHQQQDFNESCEGDKSTSRGLRVAVCLCAGRRRAG